MSSIAREATREKEEGGGKEGGQGFTDLLKSDMKEALVLDIQLDMKFKVSVSSVCTCYIIHPKMEI